MRRLASALGSPMMLGLLPILIFSIPQAFSWLFEVTFDFAWNASDDFVLFLLVSVAVAGFSIAILRSDRRMPFVSLLMMGTIFFAALIAGERVSKRAWYNEHLSSLGDHPRNLVAGMAGGLVAGLVMMAWRWAPGMIRKPILRALPWVAISGLVWGASYYVFGNEAVWPNVPTASCYGFVMFRSLGGSRILWFSGPPGKAEQSSGSKIT